jgi:hypothetical protein
MTPDEREAVRKLLIKYQAALSLAEDLALGLLDTLQADAPVQGPEALRERRRSVGDAIAMIESGDSYAQRLWADLGLDRRAAPPAAPLPAEVRKERRRAPRRK